MPSLAISPTSLLRLRQSLSSVEPTAAAAILNEVGSATGEALSERWNAYLATRAQLSDASRLDQRWFGPLLDELLSTLGWGSVRVTELAGEAVRIESRDWAEAAPGTAESPACHFSSGALAAFLSSQAGVQLAVMEVECRSAGDSRCCFMATSTDLAALANEIVMAGGTWSDALRAPEVPETFNPASR